MGRGKDEVGKMQASRCNVLTGLGLKRGRVVTRTWELYTRRLPVKQRSPSSSSFSLSLITKLTAIPKSLETTINCGFFN